MVNGTLAERGSEKVVNGRPVKVGSSDRMVNGTLVRRVSERVVNGRPIKMGSERVVNGEWHTGEKRQ